MFSFAVNFYSTGNSSAAIQSITETSARGEIRREMHFTCNGANGEIMRLEYQAGTLDSSESFRF